MKINEIIVSDWDLVIVRPYVLLPHETGGIDRYFSLLKKIAHRNNLQKLSMGMSNDFEEAIKFGATSLRVGSMFFGERQY